MNVQPAGILPPRPSAGDRATATAVGSARSDGRLALVEPDDLRDAPVHDPGPADGAVPDGPAAPGTGELDPAALDHGVLDHPVDAPGVDGPAPATTRGGESTAAVLIAALIGDAVAGDLTARDELLAVIHPMVLRYCRGRLGRQECVIGSAEDIAQDVCLAVVRALPQYRITGLSFRAFVYGIAAHKVTDAFRAIGRNRSESVADVPDAPVEHEGPEHRALAVELGERLSELLHILTPRQREVLVLRIAVGLSAEETAQVVRSTPGAVRVTQHRALTRLREHLLEQELHAAGAQPRPRPRPRPVGRTRAG